MFSSRDNKRRERSQREREGLFSRKIQETVLQNRKKVDRTEGEETEKEKILESQAEQTRQTDPSGVSFGKSVQILRLEKILRKRGASLAGSRYESVQESYTETKRVKRCEVSRAIRREMWGWEARRVEPTEGNQERPDQGPAGDNMVGVLGDEAGSDSSDFSDDSDSEDEANKDNGQMSSQAVQSQPPVLRIEERGEGLGATKVAERGVGSDPLLFHSMVKRLREEHLSRLKSGPEMSVYEQDQTRIRTKILKRLNFRADPRHLSVICFQTDSKTRILQYLFTSQTNGTIPVFAKGRKIKVGSEIHLRKISRRFDMFLQDEILRFKSRVKRLEKTRNVKLNMSTYQQLDFEAPGRYLLKFKTYVRLTRKDMREIVKGMRGKESVVRNLEISAYNQMSVAELLNVERQIMLLNKKIRPALALQNGYLEKLGYRNECLKKILKNYKFKRPNLFSKVYMQKGEKEVGLVVDFLLFANSLDDLTFFINDYRVL